MPGTSALSYAAVYRYQLKIGGVAILAKAPLQDDKITWTLAGPGGTSQMSFTVTDTVNKGSATAVVLRQGAKVVFNDTQSSTGLSFTGVMLNVVETPLPGAGVKYACTVGGLDWYLDGTVFPHGWSSKTTVGGQVRQLTQDDDVVKALLHFQGLGVMASSNITQTNTSLDVFQINAGMTMREALDELATNATPVSSNNTRRYYVDPDGLLHWYSGTEGLNPPARIADGSYVSDMLGSTGVVSFWSGRLASSTTLYDHKGYANATLTGGTTTGVASLCLNERQEAAVTLNGSSGYASASGANLHPGNTGSWGIVFKRAVTGSQQALLSGGATDMLIGFDASDHLRVQKEGTGDAWVSNATYTSTTLTYHLVVTLSAGTLAVYLNGTDVTSAGTTTGRTFAAGAGAFNIGRKLSTTDQFFNGTFWGPWVSSAVMSAANVTARYKQWFSLSADDLKVEFSSPDVRLKVYVKGSPTAAPLAGDIYSYASGLIPTTVGDKYPCAAPSPLIDSDFGSGNLPTPTGFLDEPSSTNGNKRNKIGRAWLLANNSPTRSVSFSVTYDPTQVNVAGTQTSFRQGQLVAVTSSQLNLSALTVEIKQVDVDLNLGSGVTTFAITADALSWSQLRSLRGRRGRR